MRISHKRSRSLISCILLHLFTLLLLFLCVGAWRGSGNSIEHSLSNDFRLHLFFGLQILFQILWVGDMSRKAADTRIPFVSWVSCVYCFLFFFFLFCSVFLGMFGLRKMGKKWKEVFNLHLYIYWRI